MSATDRKNTIANFRMGSNRIIITSLPDHSQLDVAAVSLVIQYDLPKDPNLFLTRCGRSGRYGRKGVNIVLIVEQELKMLMEFEHYYDHEIQEMPMNVADFI